MSSSSWLRSRTPTFSYPLERLHDHQFPNRPNDKPNLTHVSTRVSLACRKRCSDIIESTPSNIPGANEASMRLTGLVGITSNQAAWSIAGATLVALAVTIWQNAAAQRRRFEWDRKQKSLSYSLNNQPEVRDARSKIEQAFKELEIGRPAGEVLAPSMPLIRITLEKSNLSTTDIVLVLGHWENLGLSINQGVADEFVAYEMIATTVHRHTIFFRHFIASRRATSPRYYQNLILLEARWSKYLASELSSRAIGRRMKRTWRHRNGVLGDQVPDEISARYSLEPKTGPPPAGEPESPKRVLVLIDERQLRPHNSIYGILSALERATPTVGIDIASINSPTNYKTLTEIQDDVVDSVSFSAGMGYSELTRLAFAAEKNERSLDSYDGVWLRLDPPLNWSLVRSLVTRTGIPVVNDPVAMETLGRKSVLSTYFSAIAGGARTCASIETVDSLLEAWGEIVLKPDEGMGGKSIVRLSSESGFLENAKHDPDIVRAQLLADFNSGLEYVAMPYSPLAGTEGDRRLLIAGNEILGAVRRVPETGSWLANVTRGGEALPTPLDPSDLAIAEAVMPMLEQYGVALAGIDTIPGRNGDRWLSEVNVSNPGLFAQLSSHLGGQVLDKAARAVLDAMFPHGV